MLSLRFLWRWLWRAIYSEIYCRVVWWKCQRHISPPSSRLKNKPSKVPIWRYKAELWFHFGFTRKWGHAVAYSVEVLCYKPEGRGFECRWGGFFQVTYSFQAQYGPGVDSASNRNEYQECFLGVTGDRHLRLTTISPFVSRFSRKCESLDAWQLYGSLRPITGIA
jgi:hypothetical protein